MSKDYKTPGLSLLQYDFETAPALGCTQAYMTLSRMDVLAIVQSAFEEVAPQHPDLVAVKREVLEDVSEGKLAHALRKAIVGAGRTCCGCCD